MGGIDLVDALSESQYGYPFLSDDSPPTDALEEAVSLSINPHLYKRITKIGSQRLVKPAIGDQVELSYVLHPVSGRVNSPISSETVEWTGIVGSVDFRTNLPIGIRDAVTTMAHGEKGDIILNVKMPASHPYVDQELAPKQSYASILTYLPDLDRTIKEKYEKHTNDDARCDALYAYFAATEASDPLIADYHHQIDSLPFEVLSKARIRSSQQVRHWDTSTPSIDVQGTEREFASVELKTLERRQALSAASCVMTHWHRGAGSIHSSKGALIRILLIELKGVALHSDRTSILQSILDEDGTLNPCITSCLPPPSEIDVHKRHKGAFTTIDSACRPKMLSDGLAISYSGPQIFWDMSYARHEYCDDRNEDACPPESELLFEVLSSGIRCGDILEFEEKHRRWVVIGGPTRRSTVLAFPDYHLDTRLDSLKPRIVTTSALSVDRDRFLEKDDKPSQEKQWLVTDHDKPIWLSSSPLQHEAGIRLRVLLRVILDNGTFGPLALINVTIGGHYGRIPPIFAGLLEGFARVQVPVTVESYDGLRKESRSFNWMDDVLIEGLKSIDPPTMPSDDVIRRYLGVNSNSPDCQNENKSPSTDHYPKEIKTHLLVDDFETSMGIEIRMIDDTFDGLGLEQSESAYRVRSKYLFKFVPEMTMTERVSWESLILKLLPGESRNTNLRGFQLCVLDGIGRDDIWDDLLASDRMLLQMTPDHEKVTRLSPFLKQILFRRSALQCMIRNSYFTLAWNEVQALESLVGDAIHEILTDKDKSPSSSPNGRILRVPTLAEIEINDSDEVQQKSELVKVTRAVMYRLKLLIASNKSSILERLSDASARERLDANAQVLNDWPCHIGALGRFVHISLSIGEAEMASTVLKAAEAAGVNESDTHVLTRLQEMAQSRMVKDLASEKNLYSKMFA